jgi:O-antigen/teichoic acid export membrane protein
MDLLPLSFIGWFFTLAAVLALGVGALIVIAFHRAGETERNLLAQTAWNDAALFAIWILALAGGIGVLQLKPWGRHILEFFCWTLIALTCLSVTTRLYAMKREEGSINWVSAIAGALVVLIPVIALCGATIATLRSDAIRELFSGRG